MTVSRTSLFGASFSRRYGYSEYALNVRPPPHGFSQANFSSNRMVFRPALARRSAADAPAGPPPNMATVFTTCFLLVDARRAGTVAVAVQESRATMAPCPGPAQRPLELRHRSPRLHAGQLSYSGASRRPTCCRHG